jgi:hypothetical protein
MPRSLDSSLAARVAHKLLKCLLTDQVPAGGSSTLTSFVISGSNMRSNIRQMFYKLLTKFLNAASGGQAFFFLWPNFRMT